MFYSSALDAVRGEAQRARMRRLLLLVVLAGCVPTTGPRPGDGYGDSAAIGTLIPIPIQNEYGERVGTLRCPPPCHALSPWVFTPDPDAEEEW